MDPLLSVIVPAYNVERFVVQAIESVLAQSFQDYEIVVVDDGSTDASPRLVESIHDQRIRLIRQENKGLAGARNTGILTSRGRYIGFLDGDDIWFADKAQLQICAMEEDPTIGISYSYSAYIDEEGKTTGQVLITRAENPSRDDLIIRNHILPSSAVVRKACFQDAGLFDERLRACEDYEMWVRILNKTHYRARLVPQVLAGYRVRTGSLTMNFDTFISSAHQVMKIFRDSVPSFNRPLENRAMAEIYRIASRKALSGGQLGEARRLLNMGLRRCPWLVISDLRAMGTFLLVYAGFLFPGRWGQLPHDVARRAMRVFFRYYLGRDRGGTI